MAERVTQWMPLAQVVRDHRGEEWRAMDGTAWPVSVVPQLLPDQMDRAVTLVEVQEAPGAKAAQLWVLGASPDGVPALLMGGKSGDEGVRPAGPAGGGVPPAACPSVEH
jgi:hypothetical protein